MVLEQDEEFKMFQNKDEKKMKEIWVRLIFKKMEDPLNNFFTNFKLKITDTADFLKFFKEKHDKVFQKIRGFTFKKKTLIRIIKQVEEIFVNFIKNNLLFENDQQQKLVKVYDIFIRDMNIVQHLKLIWQPYLGEIAKILLSKNSNQVIMEILNKNNDFFDKMKKNIMENVQELMDIYQSACMDICFGLFDN